ncbi:TPA: RNA-directed DNA polymerase [Photobacterium damselae]
MLIHRVIHHLDEAFSYVYRRSRHKGDNDDIWDCRFHWPLRKAQLQSQLLHHAYVFSPARVVEYQPGKTLHTFRSLDKIVLKAIALTLLEVLPRSPLCFSYRGHGGVPGALRFIEAQRTSTRFAFKTDVANYYASIPHYPLMTQLTPYLDNSLQPLIYQALTLQERGLPRGSALSHVLGNFYLHILDRGFERRVTQHYCRYMDDILVLTAHKGALRRAVATIKDVTHALGLTLAYTKQQVGHSTSVAQRQIFLGHRFSPRSDVSHLAHRQ